MTLLYGSRSWADAFAGDVIQKLRLNSFVKSHIINQAGHHIYADRPEEFNRLVVETCSGEGKKTRMTNQNRRKLNIWCLKMFIVMLKTF